MASKLFQLASAAVRNAARKEFRRTEFARTVKELERAAGRGSLSPDDVARFSRRLSGIAGKRVAGDLLREMGLDEVERYARGGSGRRLFGDFLEALGPVGKLIKAFSRPGRQSGSVSLKRELQAAGTFLRAFGHVVLPPKGGTSRAEQENVADFLRSMGWKVTEPEQGKIGTEPWEKPPSGPLPRLWPRKGRKTTDIDYGDANRRNRVSNSDPLITGEMIPVVSSNVHSIGFRLDANDSSADLQSSKGTLIIRFLADGRGGKKTAPGASYFYYDVPARVFQEFRRAASKGGFVWDNIRVRGTVSGHKYSYDLAGIVDGYVPRQAGLKRGAQGEWYLKRRFRDGGGNVFESRLPETQVKTSGPNRGLPNRAPPNRGVPNRGR